jgi:hypothetical protein
MLLPRPIEKLVIVGLGMSCYDFVIDQYNNFDTSWEVWTINAGGKCFSHDVVWDMHERGWLERHCANGKGDAPLKRREWLKTHDKPVVMPRRDPEIPMSVQYPLKKVVEMVGTPYFSNGMAYPLAMALCCGVKHLKMFGVDFSYDRDMNTHDEQGRACCEFWLGRLVHSGCNIAHSQNTHLMDANTRADGTIYGYDSKMTFDFPKGGGRGVFVGPDYAD